MKDIVVLYHGPTCHDGFGAAYAARKKFGDAAQYIPLRFFGKRPPVDIRGKEVYLLDFSYSREMLQELAAESKSFVVIDHHVSARNAVESLQGSVFDPTHSGAILAWNYFHPDTPAPLLLRYIEDGDIWKWELPDSFEVSLFMSVQPFDFDHWEKLAAKFEDPEQLEHMKNLGSSYGEFRAVLVDDMIKHSEEVSFEGHRVLAANVSASSDVLVSVLGSEMARRMPPLALVWSYDGRFLSVSLRGDGSIDVGEIARRRGGGGQHSAASFKVPLISFKDFPFRFLDPAEATEKS